LVVVTVDGSDYYIPGNQQDALQWWLKQHPIYDGDGKKTPRRYINIPEDTGMCGKDALKPCIRSVGNWLMMEFCAFLTTDTTGRKDRHEKQLAYGRKRAVEDAAK